VTKFRKKARRIMEEKIGRPLHSDEWVHHKDGNPKNNAISNLMIVTQAEHSRIHAAAGDYHQITPEEARRGLPNYTQEQLIGAIKDVVQDHPQLTQRQFYALTGICPRVIRRHMGTWRSAKTLATGQRPL